MASRIREFAGRHVHALLIVWLAFVVLLPHAATGHFRGDANLYLAVMKGIVRSGEWLDLRIGDEPYFNKPPLMFWFGAALLHVHDAVYVRNLIGFVPSLGLLLTTYGVARLLTGSRHTALVAVVAMVATRIFGVYAGVPRLDAATTLCGMLAVAGVLLSRRNPRWALLVGAAVGLGLMVKGPIGLLPLVVVPVWSLLARDFAVLRNPWFWGGVVVLPPLLVAPWLGNHWLRDWDTFWLAYKVGDLDATAAGKPGTARPFVKYGKDLPVEWWPALPFFLHGAWLGIRTSWRERRVPEPYAFAFAWIGVYLTAVLFVGTAYTRYLFPLLPAGGLLAAQSVAALFPRLTDVSFRRGLAVVLVVATSVVAFGPVNLHAKHEPDLVVLLPTLRARHAHDPILYFTRRRSRTIEASAICDADGRARFVSEDDVRALVVRHGRCTVVAEVDVSDRPRAMPADLDYETLATAQDLEVVEFRAPR